jgi:hypothetical protein
VRVAQHDTQSTRLFVRHEVLAFWGSDLVCASGVVLRTAGSLHGLLMCVMTCCLLVDSCRIHLSCS